MITLLGVGHVFNLGSRVREELEKRRPSLVCLELDEVRLRSLLTSQRPSGGSVLYRTLAHFQRQIAAKYGSDVGEEMLVAYRTAKEMGIPVVLIDVDFMLTWERLRSSMRPSEIVRLLVSSLGALFIRKERIERELDRYQQDSVGLIEAIGKDFPSVKRVVVDERNTHMAHRLRELHEEYGDILAVVGDGHVAGLRSLLEGIPLDVIRLWELRSTSE